MKKKRYFAAFVVLFVLLLLFLVMNLCIGSVNIPFSEIPKILQGIGTDETYTEIVTQVRAPRAFAAVILGGALALSGYLLQTFFHNPIATPFTLGVSSGAKLIVALVMVASLQFSVQLGSWLMILAAFAGSMLCMGFVILMSKVINQMAMLIVSGVMIGYICSAVTDFVVTFADDADIVNLHNWSLGSFSGINWDNVKVMAIVVLITMFFVFLLSKPISAYQMGEAYAQNMGLNVSRFRIVLGDPVQYPFGLCNCICRTGILRRNRRSSPCQRLVWYNTADFNDSSLLLRRCVILPVLRFAGKNSIYSHRVVDQHGNCNFGRSGGYLHYATPEKRKDGVIGNESWLSIYKRFNCWL